MLVDVRVLCGSKEVRFNVCWCLIVTVDRNGDAVHGILSFCALIVLSVGCSMCWFTEDARVLLPFQFGSDTDRDTSRVLAR